MDIEDARRDNEQRCRQLHNIWSAVNILERDNAMDEVMLEIIKFVVECIANKYNLSLDRVRT